MQTVKLDAEGLAQVTHLRPDEQFRLVVARTGEYGAIYRRDSYTKKHCSTGVELKNGVYRVDMPWESASASTWEGVAYGWARVTRHVAGKFVIAYMATGTEDHIEI